MNVRRTVGCAVAVTVIGSAGLLLSPSAQAATTVSGQLSLSGIATADSPLGGQVVGLHPGDSLVLSASTAPTAGLDKLGLGGPVDGLLSGASGYQVVAHLPAGFPGGRRDVTLGRNGQASVKFTFPDKGTYAFTWDANSITLLGVAPIKLDGNQLAQAGVALNAQAQWVGKVVVSADPPSGGVSLQLPGTSIAPSVPVAGNLPPVQLPGPALPTLPNAATPPDTSSGNGGDTGGKTTTPRAPTLNYKPTGPSLADATMPKGYGTGSGLGGTYVAPGLDGSLGGPALSGNGSNGNADNGNARSAGNQAAKGAKTVPAVDLASSADRSATSGLPALLVVVAVIALSAATAGYARTFLPARPTHAKARNRH